MIVSAAANASVLSGATEVEVGLQVTSFFPMMVGTYTSDGPKTERELMDDTKIGTLRMDIEQKPIPTNVRAVEGACITPETVVGTTRTRMVNKKKPTATIEIALKTQTGAEVKWSTDDCENVVTVDDMNHLEVWKMGSGAVEPGEYSTTLTLRASYV